MHTHIIVNHDYKIFVVIKSEEEEIDLVAVFDDIIVENIKHA
tara:strand:+ start:629 stop:754 length:126 start_codon:yes stop_codon:yes gene_type:complete